MTYAIFSTYYPSFFITLPNKAREERIAKIKAYENELKNISKPSVEERATRIGKDLKETLLKKKQEDQKAAREIAINARKSKKETQIRR